MTDNEIQVKLSIALFGVGVTQAMLAHDLYGRVEPGTLSPDQAQRFGAMLGAMSQLHVDLAALAAELKEQTEQ